MFTIFRKLLVASITLIHCIICGQNYEQQLADFEKKAEVHFYTNKDSSYYYYDKIYNLSIAKKDYITTIDNLNYLCESAGYFFDTDTIQKILYTLDKLVVEHQEILKNTVDNGDFQINYLNYNKGNYYNLIENYKLSQVYFQKIEERITSKEDFFENEDDIGFLSSAYSFVAKMNSLQYRFEVADDYYQKNIRLLRRFRPHDIENLYKVYNLYANSLYRQKKFEKAKNYWRLTFLYNEANYSKYNTNSIVTTGLLLSKVYSQLNKLDSANHFLSKTKSYGIPKYFSHRYLTTRGDILAIEGKNNLAEQSLLDALKHAPDDDKPLINQKLGDLLMKQKKVNKALVYYQNGLKNLSPDFNEKDIKNNPVPENILQKQKFLSILRRKSNALNASEDLKNYNASIKTIETAITTIDLLKQSFKNDKDKAFMIEEAFPAIESGIEALFQLYHESTDFENLQKAFYLFEKSKSVVLTGALLTSNATQFSQIPKNLLEEENQTKSKILLLEKKIKRSKENSESFRDSLFNAKKEYLNLIELFEKEYPAYFNLKYNNSVIELSDFQKKLNHKTLALSYFYGNRAVYVLGISRNDVKFTKILIDGPFSKSIKDIYEYLQDPHSSIDSLASKSHFVFKKIINPLGISEDFTELLIIPDGPLNYIPFGVLNTKENDINYLMETATISYTSSVSLLHQLASKKNKNMNILAFAPSFEGEQVDIDPSRDNLLSLPHNKREVEKVLTHFDGRAFKAKNATLKNFNSQLNNYGILHLATHAIFNDASPDYSYLAFTPKDEEESVLYVRDLYNLNLNAAMVTLSACETGVGELKRGEGFLSLARGFFYSGAASIASTLWKVNDASSTTLMGSFYENLANSDTKDLALQKAKKSFLEANLQNGLAHPYYWSGFIISGNMAPLTTPTPWIWIILGMTIVAVFGFVLFKKLFKN